MCMRQLAWLRRIASGKNEGRMAAPLSCVAMVVRRNRQGLEELLDERFVS